MCIRDTCQDHASTTPDGPAGGESKGGSTHEHLEPATQAPLPPVRRKRAIRLGSELDRGVWMWLMVIGAVALIVLTIIAVSQIPSSPKKGAAASTAIEQLGFA